MLKEDEECPECPGNIYEKQPTHLEDGLPAEVANARHAVAKERVHRLDLPAEPHLGVERGHGQSVARADTGLVLSAIKVSATLSSIKKEK